MLALGLMSGTSLDGVDAALIETDGQDISGFGKVAYLAYAPDEVEVFRNALGLWPASPLVDLAAALSVKAHGKLAIQFPQAEVIGYHGQTLAHDPHGRGTHQAGCGAALSRATGRPVVWDFRTEDVRQGGEGAPLAPYFHHACARWAASRGHLSSGAVAFLNLGGVGNLTYTEPAKDSPDIMGACLAFDTGPANAPINDLLHERSGLGRDEGGSVALSGSADAAVLARFMQHPYFAKPVPKSLDRDAFSMLSAEVSGLSTPDAAATLTEAAALAVGAGLTHLPDLPQAVFVCGGGRHNLALMQALRRNLPDQVGLQPVEAIGLDGDMLEAQAFGYLAVRVLLGLPTSGPSTTAAPATICGGRISYPR